MTGPRPWGICPECGSKRSITHEGNIRLHVKGNFYVRKSADPIPYCAGSHRKPKKEKA
jgi:hypothetical protein